MKDQLPAPDFDSNQYERPNQNWVCGWASEGKSCRLGPDAKGHCSASYECKPALDLQEGESKGRFRCTRAKEFGGPCENGPQPDGTCGRPVPRCQPRRSLRAKRGRLTWAVIILTLGGLLVAFYGPSRLSFISPGKISTAHTSIRCADCHGAANASAVGWTHAALTAEPHPFEFDKLWRAPTKWMTRLDQNCQRCHSRHNFHEPNVPRDFSCSACHQEHLSRGAMPPPASENCNACHANADVMLASRRKGETLPPAAFDFRQERGEIVFKAPRPTNGYTKVFHSFAIDHPEFQTRAQNLQDPDTLKFNHRIHLGASVRARDGTKLSCPDCHAPGASGLSRQKISFEKNCRECHSLQFDPRNPDLQLPHGNPETVRAFLRSLEIQYADLGRKRGVTEQRALENFVQTQLKTLRSEKLTGENLERQIFFSTAKKSLDDRALYPGCAYCHEVKPRGELVPAITPPRIPDRWMVRARFDHAKHVTVNCGYCHQAEVSEKTADILLPQKSACVLCHSPRGGVRHDCATCHGFHATERKTLSAELSRSK